MGRSCRHGTATEKNKAVSVDLLPNEELKNNTSIDVLTSLFNFCFVNHIIPDLWT